MFAARSETRLFRHSLTYLLDFGTFDARKQCLILISFCLRPHDYMMHTGHLFCLNCGCATSTLNNSQAQAHIRKYGRWYIFCPTTQFVCGRDSEPKGGHFLHVLPESFALFLVAFGCPGMHEKQDIVF